MTSRDRFPRTESLRFSSESFPPITCWSLLVPLVFEFRFSFYALPTQSYAHIYLYAGILPIAQRSLRPEWQPFGFLSILTMLPTDRFLSACPIKSVMRTSFILPASLSTVFCKEMSFTSSLSACASLRPLHPPNPYPGQPTPGWRVRGRCCYCPCLRIGRRRS